ncbi:hypothetical protein ACTJKQ_12835 [Acidovorax sp. 22279]|uniref:hypothetical protein n=1 Tax=Acidovorax sp. 22279 TaxID=3453900 RepID=UPI003F838137
MAKQFQVSVLDDSSHVGDVAVLRVASAANNSLSQFYSKQVQVSRAALADLKQNIERKLALNRVPKDEINFSISIKFANDKTITLDAPEKLSSGVDLQQVPSTTQMVTFRVSFPCDLHGSGKSELHSIYIRIAERPHPALILQKAMSGLSDDLESLDNEAFSPVSCKIDFVDGTFSDELLSIVTQWVESLPQGSSTFGIVRWAQSHQSEIHNWIFATFPCLALLAYAGIWFSLNPEGTTTRIAVAWVICGTVVFEAARYLSVIFSQTFSKQVQRINNVPIFKITAGDENKMTKYLAKNQKSWIVLGITALCYGALKGLGLYLASKLLTNFFG